jgi:hypothetical protein
MKAESLMKTIDVHDLPEQMAKAVAETVEHLRHQVKRRGKKAPRAEQIVWRLGARGNLSREEIYEHLDD